MTQPDLLTAVEAYLANTGQTPTAFGATALNDRHFVRQLRNGRRCWPETEAKVRAYMAANPPPSRTRTRGQPGAEAA